VNGLPLRTPLAGPIGFAPAFCKRNIKRVPAFGGLSVGVSNSSSPSTVQSHARLSDLALELRQSSHRAIGAGGRTSGRDLTVEGERELETPSQWPRHAAARFCLFAEGSGESYRAGQRCSQRQPVHAFEQGNLDGTKIVPIKIFRFGFVVIENKRTTNYSMTPLICRWRLYLRLVAEGRHESYRASQQCSQRQPVHAFEQRNSDVTRIVTIKILPRGQRSLPDFPVTNSDSQPSKIT